MKNSKNQNGSKKSTLKCKICDKSMEISYEGNGIQYPVFSCPKHGIGNNLWKEWWEKYSKLKLDKDTWKDGRNRPSCVISYFCYKFEKFYGFPYVMDYSNPIPYKNKEFTMARRIITMFGNDYKQIPNYIDWIFFKKVKTKKYPLNSLGFLASSNFVNEYKSARAKRQKVNRSTKIPDEFIEWCKNNYPQVIEYHELESYNDLNILIGLVESYNNPDEASVINEARERGIIPKSGFIQMEE